MELLIVSVLLISFFVTFLTMPLWIRKAKQIGLIWADMNKPGFPKNVAGSGGLVVISGFVLSVLVFVALITFYYHSDRNLIQIFALLACVLMLALVGIVDNLIGWGGGKGRSGLRKRYRVILCLFATIPLVAINAGEHMVSIPFFGLVNLGMIYTLFIIPLTIAGAATTFNFLAGFNGLESSQGMLILSGLSVVAYLTGSSWLAVIGLCMVASLAAFWIFNKVPARVFPGDSLTYSVGGLIAIMAILGNMEKLALVFFIPYIMEIILKTRGKLEKQSWGKPNKDGSLEMPYDKVYGLEHLTILVLKKFKSKVYEKDVVWLINSFQIILILLGFLIFRRYILA